MIITDFQMPKMNGLQLLKAQTERGCKIDIRNKAVISGYIDGSNNHIMDTLGCSYFSKPFQFKELSGWLADCEKRIDLSQPVGNLS
jgi:YesN/AraC family two-component response regulator